MPKTRNPLSLTLSLPNRHINEAPAHEPDAASSMDTIPFSTHLKKPAKVPRPPLPYIANEISPSTLLTLRHACHKLIIEAEHFDPSHPPPQLPLLSPPRSPVPSTPSLSPCSSTPDDAEGKGRRMGISSIVSPILDMPPKLQHKASQIFQKPMVAAYSFAKAATQSKLSEAASLAKYRMGRKDAPPAPTRQPSSDSANKIDLLATKEPAVIDCSTGEIKTTELYLNPYNESTDIITPMLSPMPVPKDATSIPLRTAKRRPTLINIKTSTPNSAAKTAKETPVAISPPCSSKPPPAVPILVSSPSELHPTEPSFPPQPTLQPPTKIAAAYFIFPHDATPPRPSTAISQPTSNELSKKERVPSPLSIPKFPNQLYATTSLNASQIGLALGSPSPTVAAQFRAQVMSESNNSKSTPALVSNSPRENRADKIGKAERAEGVENKWVQRVKKAKSSANLRASIDRPLPPLPTVETPVAGSKTGEWLRKGSVQQLFSADGNRDGERKKRWWGLTGLKEGLKEGLAQGTIYEVRGGKKVDIGMPEVHLHMPKIDVPKFDVDKVGGKLVGWTGKWGKGGEKGRV